MLIDILKKILTYSEKTQFLSNIHLMRFEDFCLAFTFYLYESQQSLTCTVHIIRP